MGLKIVTAKPSSGLLIVTILGCLFWPLGLKGKGLKIVTARASSGLLLVTILGSLFGPLWLKEHRAEDRHSQGLQRPARRDDPWLPFLALGAEGAWG